MPPQPKHQGIREALRLTLAVGVLVAAAFLLRYVPSRVMSNLVIMVIWMVVGFVAAIKARQPIRQAVLAGFLGWIALICFAFFQSNNSNFAPDIPAAFICSVLEVVVLAMIGGALALAFLPYEGRVDP